MPEDTKTPRHTVEELDRAARAAKVRDPETATREELDRAARAADAPPPPVAAPTRRKAKK